MTVYKMGDKLLAARSNEFGFANYEIIPQPHALDPLGPAPLLEPKPAPKPARAWGQVLSMSDSRVARR